MREIRAAVGDGRGSFTIESVYLDEPQGREVLFAPAATAIPTGTPFTGAADLSWAMKARVRCCAWERMSLPASPATA